MLSWSKSVFSLGWGNRWYKARLLFFYIKLLFCLACVKIHQIFLRSFQILFQQLKGCPFNYKDHFHFKKHFTLRMWSAITLKPSHVLAMLFSTLIKVFNDTPAPILMLPHCSYNKEERHPSQNLFLKKINFNFFVDLTTLCKVIKSFLFVLFTWRTRIEFTNNK